MKAFMMGAAIVAVTALVACTDNLPTGPADAAKLRAQLVAAGVPASRIVDAGDRFILDGDIIVLKQDLRDGTSPLAGPRPMADQQPTGPLTPPTSAERQWISDAKIPGYAFLSVWVSTVGLQGNSDWADAMRDAIAEYNALPGHAIHLVEKNDGTARVRTGVMYEVTSRVAYAHYPRNGSPGDSVVANTYFNSYSRSQKKLVMMHELGHIIGFLHADWQTNGETVPPNPVRIGSTPANDNDSYMQSHSGGIAWVDFPYYDRAAIRLAYRGIGASLTGGLSGGHPVLSWPAASDATAYDVYIIYKAWDDVTGLWVDGVTEHLATLTTPGYTDTARAFSEYVYYCDANSPDPAYSVNITFPEGAVTWGSGPGAVCYR